MPSSIRQFPEFNKFFAAANTRELAHRAVVVAGTSLPKILQTDEIVQVMRNILALSFATGMRPETLSRLTVDSFRESLRGDVPVVEIVVGTMKNLLRA